MRITHRRICWPEPDATCLEGGCIHCEDHPFRTVNVIESYCKRVGSIHSRCNEEHKDMLKSFQYGLRAMEGSWAANMVKKEER